MNRIYLACASALIFSVAACSEQPNTAREDAAVRANRGEAAPANAAYSASGEVTAVSGDDVTISHGPVPDLEWPAMTMAFRASSADMLGGVAPGDQVSFAFRQADGGYVLTSLTKNGWQARAKTRLRLRPPLLAGNA